MEQVTTVVVGAGQCGLAMSRALARRSVEHIVLERGRIGERWLSERWDGLRLLTPNWMSAPAGHPYRGPDPDGFMSCTDFATSLERATRADRAPVREQTRVLSLSAHGGGYRVATDRGTIDCARVVIASGACGLPRRPGLADAVPASLMQLTARDFRRPADLPEGGVLVVGASASGLQIARDLAAAGRRVTLAVGNHLRLPRRYRGADILWWMDRIGALDVGLAEADAARLLRLPSLPLSGATADVDLDLNALHDIGVEIVGRLSAIADGVAWFSGSLANTCASADLKLRRLLDRIDAYAEAEALDAGFRYRPLATRVPETPRLSCRLGKGDMGAVIWATGFEPDHAWVKLPLFDAKGRIRHVGGVVGEGLYVMGLRYLRTARSSHISGAERDAEVLANHLAASLARQAAA